MSTSPASILSDPAKPVPMIPSDQVRLPVRDRITYWLRLPTVTDRVAFPREVAEAGGINHSNDVMLAALVDGVKQIMPNHAAEQARLLEIIAEQRAKADEFGRRILSRELDFEADPAGFMAAMAATGPSSAIKEIEAVVQRHWAHYRGLIADRETYPLVRGLVAARLFLTGWDNMPGRDGKPVAFPDPVPPGGVPDDLLSLLPSAHLVEIGQEIQRLLEPSGHLLKNLQSPSGGGFGRRTSKAAKPRQRKAPLKATGGKSRKSASPA
ncbi:hypothetical protein [Oceanibaculum indicum]|uniref:Uncharacterized protein n=1 Tax=Oceanibaculum indicum P24 TaxID=1207063 RepID=K2K040_9PROT|nr:hypothetical protein [Oceanibaculum indicum]EKE70895.1 hypothetical protein P24_15169 [Oceanibaculum indicum P24]